MKLYLADAVHNLKWAKMIKIWQNGDQRFFAIGVTFNGSISLACFKGGIQSAGEENKNNHEQNWDRWLKRQDKNAIFIHLRYRLFA